MATSLSKARRSTSRRGRRRLLVGAFLSTAGIGVLSAAVAWACVPATSMGFDRSPYEYKAGETVRVTAQGFFPNEPYSMTLTPPGGSEGAVGNGLPDGTGKADSSGLITDSFVLPANAALGDYVVKVSNSVKNANGTTSSRVARETLTVVRDPVPAGPGPVVPPPSIVGPGPSLAPAIGTSFINGTSGNDTLTGTPFADVINCGAGNDRVRGAGGNDVIRCGAGNDSVDGGKGTDRISGGRGNDKLAGGIGNDTLRGDAGKDTLRGGAGKDTLLGGSGADKLFRDGRDRLRGGAGRDSTVAVK